MTRKVDIGEPPVLSSEPPEPGKPHQFSLAAAMALIAGASSGPGQFPPLMARKPGSRAPAGLLIQAAACLVLIVVFKPDAIASIGSAVALLIFMLATAGGRMTPGSAGSRVSRATTTCTATRRRSSCQGR